MLDARTIGEGRFSTNASWPERVCSNSIMHWWRMDCSRRNWAEVLEQAACWVGTAQLLLLRYSGRGSESVVSCRNRRPKIAHFAGYSSIMCHYSATTSLNSFGARFGARPPQRLMIYKRASIRGERQGERGNSVPQSAVTAASQGKDE